MTDPNEQYRRSLAQAFGNDHGKNWEEDYPLENGQYFCTCAGCGDMFMGHKRRWMCKVCVNTSESK